MKFKPSCILLGILFLFCACRNDKKINEHEILLHQRGRDILEYIKLVEQQKSKAIDRLLPRPSRARPFRRTAQNSVHC